MTLNPAPISPCSSVRVGGLCLSSCDSVSEAIATLGASAGRDSVHFQSLGGKRAWKWWMLGINLLFIAAPACGETTPSLVGDSLVPPLTPPAPLIKGGALKPTSFIEGKVQEDTVVDRKSQVPSLVPPLPNGVGGVAHDVSQAQATPQPQATPKPSAQDLDLKPEIIENSPVLQRWRRQVPNVLDDIRNDPSFRTRLRLGYSQFPSTDGASGFNVGVDDVFIGRTGLTVSGDYQRSFNGERESFGTDLRYYLLPLGGYVNVAPQVGYRNVTTGQYSTDGVNVGARLMLALSRTGAADISLTQSFVSPGSSDEVGITTLSFGYALTRHWRLSTDIQKQNSRERKDSRVGIVLEWMPF